MGEKKNAHMILVGKPEGRRPLGIHGYRWEDNIKMYIREIGRGNMAHDRDQWKVLMDSVMNLRVP
jgi:hypothetical protein